MAETWCVDCDKCADVFDDCTDKCVCDAAPNRCGAHPSCILDEALSAVFGERERSYGHPRDDFRRIAHLWDGYMTAKYGMDSGPETDDWSVEIIDVPCLMILLKMARLMESPTHRDSWVDIAGYAQAGARAVGVDD